VTDVIPPATGLPIVFYTPHQDDETLFMGQVITHHAMVGREVHVVLCSNGSTSNVTNEINGLIGDTNFWGGPHWPAREGYPPMTTVEMGLHRTEELIAACGQLGVPRERVHLGRADVEYADSSELPNAITVGWATQVMESWQDHFADRGVVSHYTMWWGDNHPDHAALGQALHNLRTADPTTWTAGRWLVKPEQAVAAAASLYIVPAELSEMVKWLGLHAGWCYRAWLPPLAYALGYHSVGNTYFDDVARGDPNHIRRTL
jgi:LmbE family N-acetylglucosaminyl deacetylase